MLPGMPSELRPNPATDEIADQSAWLPPAGAHDIDYVRAGFVAMADAARPHVTRGLLPRATYVLPDGTPMVPPDHAELLDEAGGQPEEVATVFRERFVAAGGEPGEVEETFASWLTGEFGACLRVTTPEATVVKGALMTAITALLARAAPTSEAWCGALRASVDALDAHERPFARYDRERFGGPVSRDRYVTAVRERFPELWA
jgi:hypothetical protein